MSTYYTLLGVSPQATPAEIDAAYEQQRARYNPERVAYLDPDMRQLADARTAELNRAYAVLSDSVRRGQYDASISTTPEAGASTRSKRKGLSPRERTFVFGGTLAAIIIMIAIWVITGQNAGVQGQAMGEVDRPAPLFSLQTLDGESINLAAYQGKVVLVNFWGTWCEPCQRELPALQAASQRYADQGLVVIGVNLTDDEITRGQSEEGIRAFIESYHLTYPIVMDRDGRVTDDFRVFPLPTSFFIDAHGRIRYVHVGELTINDVTARFTELQQDISAVGAP